VVFWSRLRTCSPSALLMKMLPARLMHNGVLLGCLLIAQRFTRVMAVVQRPFRIFPPGSLDIPIRAGDRALLICMSQPLRAEPWAQGGSPGPPCEWARRESTGDESLSNHRFTGRSTSFALCIERRSMLNGSPRGEETGARAISSGIISLRENASPVHLSIHLAARPRYGLRLLP